MGVASQHGSSIPPPVPDSAAHTKAISRKLSLLRQLEWRVRHAVANVLSGEYRSAFRGRGMEFDQVVKYEFGDDVRDIDWNVTARLGEPYRKKFVEEREVTLLVVFEDSPSLQFGSTAVSKREALLELAGLVMLLGAVNRDRVGYVHATPQGYHLREPVRGRGPILHAAASLIGSPPPGLMTAAVTAGNPDGGAAHTESRHTLDAHQAPNESGTNATSIPWRTLARALPRHSIILWLSDFPPRTPPEGWSVLQRRFQTMGFRVDDPWERELPQQGGFAAYDPIAQRLVPWEGSASERAAHAAWRERREQGWQSLFPDPLGRLVLCTTENRLDTLVRFFHTRMRAGHHGPARS